MTQQGAVKCTGGNYSGQLGDGGVTPSTVPVQVSGLEAGVREVFAGWQNSCAIKELGELVCWGSNILGQLGNGTTANDSGPLHIADNVADAAIGPGFICYLEQAGDALCAGRNNFGEMGIGTHAGPQDCAGVPCSQQFTQALGGPYSEITALDRGVCALPAAGGAPWCWGANDWGQLGQGTTTGTDACGWANNIACSPTPLEVQNFPGEATDIDGGADHVCALVGADAVCWGSNIHHQMGIDTSDICACEPEPVVAATGVTELAAGANHTCVIANEAAKCAGRNEKGQGGTGQVSTSGCFCLETWEWMAGGDDAEQIDAGTLDTCLVKVDGAVFCTGDNTEGQIGDGTNGDPSCDCRPSLTMMQGFEGCDGGVCETPTPTPSPTPHGFEWDNPVIGQPVNISNAGSVSTTPPVVYSDVEFTTRRGSIASWNFKTGNGNDVGAAVSQDGGRTWGPAANLSKDGMASADPFSQAPWIREADAGVVWLRDAGGGCPCDLMVSMQPNEAGETWGAAEVLAQDVVTPLNVATANDRVEVEYTVDLGPLGVRTFVITIPPDGSFGAPQETPFVPAVDHAVWDSAGNGWDVVINETNSTVEVWKATFGPGGLQWEMDHSFPWPADFWDAWIETDANGSTVQVYWETGALAGVRTLRHEVYWVDGGEWTNPPLDIDHLPPPADISYVPKTLFAGFGDYQAFAWVEDDDTGNAQVAGATSTDGGQTWGQPTPLSPEGVRATDPHVLVTDDGKMWLTYKVGEGNDAHVEMIEYDELKNLGSGQKVDGLNDEFNLTDAVLTYLMGTAPQQGGAAPAGQTPETAVLVLGTMIPEGGSEPGLYAAQVGMAADADCNGTVNTIDALAVLRSAAGLSTSAACVPLANVNCTGHVPDSLDALLILRSVAALPVNVPADCPSVVR